MKIHLPKPGRPVRIVLNLLLCLLLLLPLWSYYIYPLPNRYWNFRRIEHYYLIPCGQLVYRREEDNMSLYVDERDGWAAAGHIQNGERPAAFRWGNRLWLCPLEEGPALVPLHGEVLLLHAPGEAEGAELTLLPGPDGPERLELTGEFLGENRFRFAAEELKPSYSLTDALKAAGRPYILRLYGGAGGLLLEQRGLTPEPRLR